MEEKTAWDIYFAQLCSWRLHPGYLREESEIPTIRECAVMADVMLEYREERWPQ